MIPHDLTKLMSILQALETAQALAPVEEETEPDKWAQFADHQLRDMVARRFPMTPMHELIRTPRYVLENMLDAYGESRTT